VLVLDAVDVGSVGPIVQQAKQRHVPVIAYDRLIPDQDVAYYVSFDNVRQGRLQAQSLVDKLGAAGKGKAIVMINGAPTDPSAGDYKKGAHQVFDRSGLKIAKEYDTSDWSPDKAQREMEQAMTAIGKNGFAGVYSANDGMAGGAIAALKGGGVAPASRPITGGDSEVSAIQRILKGEQYSTIYLTIKKQAETAAPRRRGGPGPARTGGPRQRQGGQRERPHQLGPPDARRRHQGQHRRHGDQGGLAHPRGDLHGRVRGRVQGGGDRLTRDEGQDACRASCP